MRITIAAIGRLKDGPERELFMRYTKRMDEQGRALALGPLRTCELPECRASGVGQRRADEASRLLDAAADAEIKVALDGTGKTMTSEALAKWLAAKRDAGTRTMAFLIGGPDGHGPQVLESSDIKLSLGPMTLPHGLARIILAEQLYRATTILAGHPYHRA